MKRGNWVVEAVAPQSFVNHGIRHFKSGLYRAEALRLRGRWKRTFRSLQVFAIRWEAA